MLKLIALLLVPNAFCQMRALPALRAMPAPALPALAQGRPLPAAPQPSLARPLARPLPLPASLRGLPSAEADSPDRPYLRLHAFEVLDGAERGAVDARLRAAEARALSGELDLADRLQALAFIAQVGILSLHDPATRRLAEARLFRLRSTLGRIRMDAANALQTLYDHANRPVPDESRNFMLGSVRRYLTQ